MTNRSKRLRESAKVAPHCFGCGLQNPNGDLLCLAHSNALADGRGVGHKSDDDKGAILCDRCHKDVDGLTGWTKDQKRAYHKAAHLRTLAWWITRGVLVMTFDEWIKSWPMLDHGQYDIAKAAFEAGATIEREECAKACEDYAKRLAGINHNDHPMPIEVARDCAEEIRARSSN